MPAEVLWKERFPLYELMRHRASIGPAAFASEHQSDPHDPSLSEWQEEYFSHAKFWFDVWPDRLAVKVVALDPSKGARDRLGDYAAVIRFGRDSHGWEYVEADLSRNRPVEEMCHEVVRHYREFQAEGLGLESDLWQELLCIPLESARKAAGLEEMRVFRLTTGGIPKPTRIRQLGEPLAQRRLRFRSRSPGTALLVQQLREFPSGEFDDGPDALHLARRTAIALQGKKAKRKQPERLTP